MTISILAHPREDEISANHTPARDGLPRIATVMAGEVTLIFRQEHAGALLAIATVALRAHALLTEEVAAPGLVSEPPALES